MIGLCVSVLHPVVGRGPYPSSQIVVAGTILNPVPQGSVMYCPLVAARTLQCSMPTNDQLVEGPAAGGSQGPSTLTCSPFPLAGGR